MPVWACGLLRRRRCGTDGPENLGGPGVLPCRNRCRTPAVHPGINARAMRAKTA